MNQDIISTFYISAGDPEVAHLAGLSAEGKTLKEATLNVFRLLPRCENFDLYAIRELIKLHPDSYGKRLIESILS
jgi:hypothetical protein